MATEIAEAFRPYLERPRTPPGDPVAKGTPDTVWRVVIEFDEGTQAINAVLPEGWGTGNWMRLLLMMNLKYGNQLVDDAIRLETEARQTDG